jgi:hypothetical protein
MNIPDVTAAQTRGFTADRGLLVLGPRLDEDPRERGNA